MSAFQSEQDQQVTVRYIARWCRSCRSAVRPGRSIPSNRSLADPAEASLKTGDLVEVTARKLFTSERSATGKDETIIVAVEHSLDRERLALVQQTWRSPAEQ